MTESQWFSSINPAVMRAVLVERGLWDGQRRKLFVQVCRMDAVHVRFARARAPALN